MFLVIKFLALSILEPFSKFDTSQQGKVLKAQDSPHRAVGTLALPQWHLDWLNVAVCISLSLHPVPLPRKIRLFAEP